LPQQSVTLHKRNSVKVLVFNALTRLSREAVFAGAFMRRCPTLAAAGFQT
jgi:hypothetical protein